MNLIGLLQSNRSYRRFDESHRISVDKLKYLVSLTRYSASGRNAQPLKYMLINEKKLCDSLFPFTSWAGYLKTWDGPDEGERPAAYIIVLKDTAIGSNIFCDDGIAIQTIMLGAAEKGLGGCIIGAFNRQQVIDLMEIPERFEPLYVLALGKPSEKVVLEDIVNDDVKYWRDMDDVHHVPKRTTDELIVSVNK
jgi:nitroreductase